MGGCLGILGKFPWDPKGLSHGIPRGFPMGSQESFPLALGHPFIGPWGPGPSGPVWVGIFDGTVGPYYDHLKLFKILVI